MIDKKFIIIFAVIALGVPVAVNIFVSANRLWDYPVAGGAWVGFWASYLGSLIATSTSFYILQRKFKEARDKEERERNNEEFKELQNDIADKISAIDFTEIVAGHLEKEALNPSVECNRLQALSHLYTQISNSVHFKYEISSDTKRSSFGYSFEVCISEAITLINNLTKFLYPIRDNNISEKYGEFVELWSKTCKEVLSLQQRFKDEVVSKAEAYINEMKEKCK